MRNWSSGCLVKAGESVFALRIRFLKKVGSGSGLNIRIQKFSFRIFLQKKYLLSYLYWISKTKLGRSCIGSDPSCFSMVGSGFSWQSQVFISLYQLKVGSGSLEKSYRILSPADNCENWYCYVVCPRINVQWSLHPN